MLLLTPCAPPATVDAPPLWDWVQWHDPDGTVRQGQATAAELPADNDTVLVVPAERLSWHQVKLPKVQIARLRQTLEGLLEDKLLEDPAQLHFALAPGVRPDRGPVTAWVAVCAKVWLQSALRDLQKHQRGVARIVPAVQPLARQLCLAQNRGEVRTLSVMGPHGVLRVDASMPAASLRAVLEKVNPTGTETAAWADPVAAGWAEVACPDWRWQPTGPTLLARQQSESDWNLAQFDLRSASGQMTQGALWRGLHNLWKHRGWRPMRWGLATLAMVHLLGLNVLAWQAKHNMKAQQAEMQTLLTQTFAHVTLVLDAPLQMQREMDRLHQAEGNTANSGFERLLQTLAAASPNQPLDLQEIRYQSGQASLHGLTGPQENAIENALQAAGWTVQRQGAQWQLSRGDRQ